MPMVTHGAGRESAVLGPQTHRLPSQVMWGTMAGRSFVDAHPGVTILTAVTVAFMNFSSSEALLLPFGAFSGFIEV